MLRANQFTWLSGFGLASKYTTDDKSVAHIKKSNDDDLENKNWLHYILLLVFSSEISEFAWNFLKKSNWRMEKNKICPLSSLYEWQMQANEKKHTHAHLYKSTNVVTNIGQIQLKSYTFSFYFCTKSTKTKSIRNQILEIVVFFF